jgi:hypothetical protein
MYYNDKLVTNSKFQTQLSRKLQWFRTCRKNKKCSIFHDLFEYNIFSYEYNLLDCPLTKPEHSSDPNSRTRFLRCKEFKEYSSNFVGTFRVFKTFKGSLKTRETARSEVSKGSKSLRFHRIFKDLKKLTLLRIRKI